MSLIPSTAKNCILKRVEVVNFISVFKKRKNTYIRAFLVEEESK
jgi:hypothetical protein